MQKSRRWGWKSRRRGPGGYAGKTLAQLPKNSERLPEYEQWEKPNRNRQLVVKMMGPKRGERVCLVTGGRRESVPGQGEEKIEGREEKTRKRIGFLRNENPKNFYFSTN